MQKNGIIFPILKMRKLRLRSNLRQVTIKKKRSEFESRSTLEGCPNATQLKSLFRELQGETYTSSICLVSLTHIT